MKLFHLSLSLIDEFKPRVPIHTRDDENKSINRICLSSNIENCLSAVGWGGSVVREEDILYGVLTNYKESKPIAIYQFDIDEQYLLSPEQLVKNNYVKDALINDEYWYIGDKKLIPKTIKFISIYDFVIKKVYLSEKEKIYKFMNIKYKELNDVILGQYITVESDNKISTNNILKIDKIFSDMHPSDNFTDVGFFKIRACGKKSIIDIGEPIIINKGDFKERILKENINFKKIY